MSRTVCSWCKAPLVLKDDILVCSNTDCPACDEKYLHEELIRTRKALDRAKWWLHEIVESHRYTPISTAEMALKEITADHFADVSKMMEQKDK